MGKRWWKLVTTDESAILAKPFLDPIVVEESQRDGRFADSASTDESDGCEAFSEADDLLDQLVASETGERWGREFSERDAGSTCKAVDYTIRRITDLA